MERSMREDLQDLMDAVMDNPLIAEKIFEQAEFDDKKNLRLINRFWRDYTLEEWRSNSAAICIMFPEWRDPKYFAKRCPFVETFERMMEGRQEAGDWPAPFRIQEQPFRKVILIDGFFSIPNCEGRSLGRSVADVEKEFKVFKFLDKFGPQLDYLRLEKGVISLEKMKWIVQKGCPQLQTLSLELSTYEKLSLQPSVSRFKKVSLKTPQVESRLTKLEIWRYPGWYEDEEESEIKPDDLFRTVPNLKSLKYGERQYISRRRRFYYGEYYHRHRYWVGFPITDGLCLPLANGKYLELEELDFQMYVNSSGSFWPHPDIIRGLSRYIELAQPSSFKKFRIELDFGYTRRTSRLMPWESFAIEYPHLDQFFLANGHLLTHLQIEVRRSWVGDGPKLASDLTGYNLPNLTHLTVYINNDYTSREHIYYSSKMGPLSLVLDSLKGIPKLQVLRCVGPRLGVSPLNLPIDLMELKEFVFNCGDKLTVRNLRMILGRAKVMKKLTLILDEKTFPLVFEMAPHLEQLILLGKDGGLTEIEKETGKMWLGPMERAIQEMEWNKKRSPSETRKSETESDGESGKDEEEGWTVVNHRKPKEKKKTNRKDTTFVYLPRRPRSTKVERYGQLVDDFTVFCKLQEMKGSVRIFRTKEFKYKAWGTKCNLKLEGCDLIEYKI